MFGAEQNHSQRRDELIKSGACSAFLLELFIGTR
jgi:hypothetical protein